MGRKERCRWEGRTEVEGRWGGEDIGKGGRRFLLAGNRRVIRISSSVVDPVNFDPDPALDPESTSNCLSFKLDSRLLLKNFNIRY